MKTNEIIETLSTMPKDFPKEAILEARKQKISISSILLKNLEDISNNPDLIFETDLYRFGLYLLAEFRDKRAFPIIIKILNLLDEEDLDYMLGDILTEGLKGILASTFDGNFNLLFNIIENKEKNEYLRASTLDALAILYNENAIDRNFFIKYLTKIINNFSDKNNMLTLTVVSIVSDLKLKELIPNVELLFKNKKVDEHFMTFDGFIKYMNNPSIENYNYINNCIEEMCSLIEFNENLNSDFDRKIGRNELCPCGSGKKYKKCCGK